MTQPRLEVRNLSKTFSGVTVLDRAHLRIEPGEIHALVGQNGSGKSTLIKLISGVYRADPGGDVIVDGTRIGTPISAGSLHDEGLSFVHQDLGLVPDLSVRENVRIGRHSINRFTRRINKSADAEAVRASFAIFGIDIDPETNVRHLRPSERIAVAVARALQDRTPGTGVVVFDESSRAIPHEALDDFYGMIRMLAEQGTAVLIVSHDLKEVLRITDRVTALRNGRIVETGVPTAELDEAAITRLVLGRSGELDDYAHTMPSPPREGTIELREVAGDRVHGVSARVGRGEVLGFTGTVDSGLSSLAPLITGTVQGTGAVVVDDAVMPLAEAGPARALGFGIAYIPQDRHGEGLATDLTVEENITLPHLTARGSSWATGKRWQRKASADVIAEYDVQPSDRLAVVANMSGGNQQKVLMGKWMLGGPALLVLDDPTQAVDVGARAAVLRATRQAAVDGAAVILCSSEVEDLAAVCDRVVILENGRVAREITQPFTADDLLAATFAEHDGEES